MANPILLPVITWARRLRHPTLFKLVVLLFAIDLVLPDPIPFIDEILMGLATVLLASWKDRRTPTAPERSPRRR